jgi:hypothetical protein
LPGGRIGHGSKRRLVAPSKPRHLSAGPGLQAIQLVGRASRTGSWRVDAERCARYRFNRLPQHRGTNGSDFSP